MKKKTIKIALFVILFLLFATAIVLYCIFPEQVRGFALRFYELLNQPLPIVGVTATAVLIFVWKIIITTNYGKKKLIAYDEKQKQLEKEYQEFLDSANSEINELKEENELLKEKLAYICSLSTNIKIKSIGKELDNEKETTND